MILFPPAASTIAPSVDRLTLALLAMSAVLSLAIAGTIVFYCVRYREGSEAPRRELSLRSQRAVEAVWIAGPVLAGLFFFAWGARLFVREKRAPPDALEIRVIGRQWMWQVQHPEGRREIDELHVPAGRPVRLIMTSQDVIHSLFIPEFRVKQDVLPDRITSLWFEAAREGVFQLVCSQYCGSAHAHMRGKVVVLSGRDYARWLGGGEAALPPAAAERGARLFRREACVHCHPRAGGKGPPLERVAGRAVRLAGDRVALADDAYLRESIVDPGAKLVAGYPNLMPSYRGRLSEAELADLLDYLRVKGRGSGEAP